MSRGALITGTTGGVIGAITAAIGIIWLSILNTFQTEIYNYLAQIGTYLSTLVPFSIFYGEPFPFPIIPFLPSWSLFGLSSSILAVFFIVSGILIGIGFYGTYKIGGGAMGVVGLILGIIGCTLGALQIILGNLLTATQFIPMPITPYIIPVILPNFTIMWIGFMVLGVTFILLGSASITVREMTMNPSASQAAGILSIIGGSLFLLCVLFLGGILFIGFILIFVAFILWAAVFYTSRYM